MVPTKPGLIITVLKSVPPNHFCLISCFKFDLHTMTSKKKTYPRNILFAIKLNISKSRRIKIFISVTKYILIYTETFSDKYKIPIFSSHQSHGLINLKTN